MINDRKKEDGITLIALIVTIIVLLILAAIAISMVSGNNGILTKATDAKKANEQGTIGDRVRLAVQAALIDGEGTINISDTEGDAKGSLYNALEEEFGSEVVNEYAGDGKITLHGKVYSVSTTGSVTEPQWIITEDNGDKVLSKGDLLSPTNPEIESEKFYVINIDENGRAILLAQKNLNTNTNIQADNANTVRYSSNGSEVYTNSSIKEMVDIYVSKLSSTGISLETVSGINGRLMLKEEANGLKANYSDILYGKSYWLGDGGSEAGRVGVVDGLGASPGISDCGCVIDDTYGVRPVIVVLTSNIK